MAVNSMVPTINVTPQSPTGHPVSKPYSILDLNFKQLHRIVEAVQNMKYAIASPVSANNQIMRNSDQYIRISCSCPSLNEFRLYTTNAENNSTVLYSRCDRSSSLTAPCISAHPCKQRVLSSRKNGIGRIMHSLNNEETLRRRSWAALEDLSLQQEIEYEMSKRKSFSSEESETEISTYDKIEFAKSVKKSSYLHSLPHVSSNGSTISSISAHSINEGDVFYDFINVRLKRESDSHSLRTRTPVHKSVSTPSVLAAALCESSPDLSSVHSRPGNVENAYVNADSFCIPKQRPSGTESETEEEILISTLKEQMNRRFPYDEIESNASYIDKFIADHSSVINSFPFEDRPKTRKRGGGSLFFRKKKEKTKKDNGAHSWKSNIHQNSSRTVLCDWCSKPVEIKYTQRCSNCQLIVHDGVCIQHFSSTECKPKSSSKVTEKRTPPQPLNKCNNKKNSSTPMVAAVSQSNSSVINRGENSDFIKSQQSRENHQHIIDYPEEVPLIAQEFLNEEQVGPSDLDTDPFLGLQDEEPDTWTPNVSKEILKKLSEKEIKRQEHIYEFVLTEKHHCLTLILMQKIFVDGLKKHFQLGPNLHRMFPRLRELTEIHLKFLYNLRKRQREAPVVGTISDILLEQFSGSAADKLKAVYGEFCSRHRDSVDIYKYFLSENPAFSAFVKHCQNNPLLKKKGIPECILFVTQRLTKYPLLIEPLIKTSKENKNEIDQLSEALALVRKILVEVDLRVAEKEKEDRKLEIYNKIDPKSWTTYRGNRFKKSDLLGNSRKLIFEGQAQLMQNRTKLHPVHVIVLSDVLFFLVENSNNKFAFYTPEDKAGVISLQKLLVREQAGNDSRSIFLISSNQLDPEMFDLKILKPKEKNVWINSIRLAVQNCPEDDQIHEDDTTAEEQQRSIVSQAYMHQIVGDLRQKDVEQALIYEEKIAVLLKLLTATGVEVDIEQPSYRQLVAQYLDGDTIRKEVLRTIQKVHEITSALYYCGTNLSRSASSVGEHQSHVYVSPILPRRAETFGGFDNLVSCRGLIAGMSLRLSQQFPKKNGNDLHESEKSFASSPIKPPDSANRKLNTSKSEPSPHFITNSPKHYPTVLETPSIMQLEVEQQSTVVLLTSHIYTLASIIAQQMSTIESLEAQIMLCRQELHPSPEKERKPTYKLNQHLEELRNLQDKLTQEKQQWQRERDAERKELEEKRQHLHKLQEQVRMEQEDVTEQREQLYRKLEAVSSQGLVNAANPPLLMSPQPVVPSPNMPVSPGPPSIDSCGSSSFSSSSLPIPSFSSSSPFNSWKRHKESFRWNKPPTSTSSALPLNLISATNQQKVATNVQIKQKLPLKLAMKPEKSSNSGSRGIGTSGGSGGTNSSPLPGISTTSALSAVSHLCSSSTLQSSAHQKSQQSKGTSFLRKSTPRLLNIKLSPKDES